MPALKMGDMVIDPPIIQGGMGIRVSAANLAAAVADTGCVGVIAASGLGQFETSKGNLFEQNAQALREEIRKAKSMSNGLIGVNIMVAVTDYDDLCKAAIDEDIDIIISGAGLPLSLPQYLNGKNTKLVPVVSSARSFQLICRRWKNQFDRLPDAVIVEGVKAGGHLGYSQEDTENDCTPTLEEIVREVVKFSNTFEPKIPVIAAGGVFDGEDIAHFLKLGASGVQMATRFVCTDECDAHENFKQAYLNASADDITIVKSPVGLPGRVINSEFVERIKRGETVPFKCRYKCLRTCDPKTAPYCIAQVLSNASLGKLDEGFAFAGSNACKCTEIIPVQTLVDKIKAEYEQAVQAEKQCAGT